jgi:aspartyl protease family protein
MAPCPPAMNCKRFLAFFNNWRPRAAIILIAISGAVQAQVVALSGISGSKALLVVDGKAPKFLSVGESHAGVKLLQVQGDVAVVDIQGQRANLRLGEAPVHVGTAPGAAAGAGGQRIVLPVNSGGHFFAEGQINGRAIRFLVDTGATAVSIGVDDAERMGLSYKQGRQIPVSTANGRTTAWMVKLDTVAINGVVAREVDAIVTPAPMPFVLLGNSFLSRFEMNRSHDQLVLLKRF